MLTFAKIENDIVINPFIVETRDDLAGCAHPDWFEHNGGMNEWVSVPNGTLHGAHSNGDGTFTNPADQFDPTKGRALNAAEFCRVGNRSNAVKFNAMLAALQSASILLADYKDVRGIDYGDATNENSENDTRDLLNTAIAAGLLTNEDVAAFMVKWVEMFPQGS